jgi:hypothetical protein
MAIVHTKPPTKLGELRLAAQLKALPDDSLHLWFSVNFVPNVKDIDLILWHELAGMFVVEVFGAGWRSQLPKLGPCHQEKAPALKIESWAAQTTVW